MFSIQGKRVFALRFKGSISRVKQITSSVFKKYVCAIGDGLVVWDINSSLEAVYESSQEEAEIIGNQRHTRKEEISKIIAVEFSNKQKSWLIQLDSDGMIKVRDFEDIKKHKYLLFIFIILDCNLKELYSRLNWILSVSAWLLTTPSSLLALIMVSYFYSENLDY